MFIQTNRQEAFSFGVNGSPIRRLGRPGCGRGWVTNIAKSIILPARRPLCRRHHRLHPAHRQRTLHRSLHRLRPDHLGPLGAYNAGNYHDGRGTYHVNEVFVEFGVPLLNDTFWGKADLDIAGRHARYSTAGDANTWKVGLTWETPIPGVRLRALQSRDIRAPNLSELFAAAGLRTALQQRLHRSTRPATSSGHGG